MKNILVIGDLMLDVTIRGAINRLCPEAPIPVFDCEKINSNYEIGGAGNVALHLHEKYEPLLMSVVGNDGSGTIIDKLLTDAKIKNSVMHHNTRPTTLKTRYYLGNQLIFRADKEVKSIFGPEIFDSFTQRLPSIIRSSDGIIISDYEKGLLYPRLIQFILEVAYKNNKLVFVDPKKVNIKQYFNCEIVKMNFRELFYLLNKQETYLDIKTNMIEAYEQINCKHLVVTNSDKPTLILSNGEKFRAVEHPKEVLEYKHYINPVGAGDVFMANLVCIYLDTNDINYSVEQANNKTFKEIKSV